MSLLRRPSLKLCSDKECGLGTPFTEDLRGPLSDDDLAFLQAWVDFAPDVSQQYPEPELDESLEIDHETLVLATRKFALAQRLALRADAPHGQDYKTFGNTIFSPRVSSKSLCDRHHHHQQQQQQQLLFNPLFGAAFHSAAAESDDEEAAGGLLGPLRKQQLSYEYEAVMRADMRDLEAFGLINWSPDDLVDAELERSFTHTHDEHSNDQSADPAKAAPSHGGKCGGECSAAASTTNTNDSSSGGEVKRVGQVKASRCGRLSLGDGTGSRDGLSEPPATAAAAAAAAGDFCPSPGTPAAARVPPYCFRGRAEAHREACRLGEGAAARTTATATATAAACSDAAAAQDDAAADEEKDAWRRFLDGLGHLPYEYEALLRADMRDLEAFGFIDWSPEDLVDAELARSWEVPPPAPAPDPWVACTVSTSHAMQPATSARPQTFNDTQTVSSDIVVGGGSGGGGSAASADATGAVASLSCMTSPGGDDGRPFLALPAPCLSAPTGLCSSPISPPTPAASCAPPWSFQAPPAVTCHEAQRPVEVGSEAVIVIALAADGAGSPGGSDGAGGGDDNDDETEEAEEEEAWRRFLDDLGELPYEYEALLRADMRDLEAFGFIDWSPEDLVDAELARSCGLPPPAPAGQDTATATWATSGVWAQGLG